MQHEKLAWFDADHPHAAAGVFLLTDDRRLILQLRDQKPDIENPGMITAFAGGAEPGETPMACALRELEEETGLAARAEDLRLLGGMSRLNRHGRRVACVFYLLTGVDPDGLVITEGQSIILTLPEIATETRLAEFSRFFCQMIIEQFSQS